MERSTYFNEAAEMLTELSSSQAIQKPMIELFKREHWLIELVKKSQPPRQETTRGEGDLVTRWGHKVPVGLTVSPLQDRHGNFLGTILVLRDLKHRKELEEDLKRADRLAMVGTLAAGLAHEIRNPLGGIKGAAQLLKRSLDRDSSLMEYANIMIREVDRVDKLIEQLLDLVPTCKTGTHSPSISTRCWKTFYYWRRKRSDGAEHQRQETIRPEPASDPRRPSTTDASFSQPGEKRLSGHEWRRRFDRHDTARNRLSHSRSRQRSKPVDLGGHRG